MTFSTRKKHKKWLRIGFFKDYQGVEILGLDYFCGAHRDEGRLRNSYSVRLPVLHRSAVSDTYKNLKPQACLGPNLVGSYSL